MAISYVATGATAEGGGAGLAVAYPAGIAAGDVLLLEVGTGTTATVVIPDPAGWTNVFTQVQSGTYAAGIWLKVATGLESGTLSVSTPGQSSGVMHAFRGVDNTTPQDVAASTLFQTSGVGTGVLPSVTAATVGAVPVWLGFGANAARTATSTGTEIFDGGSHFSGFAYYDTAVGATGAIGTRTVTYGGGNTRDIAAMVLLRPAAAPPTTSAIMMVV